MKEEYERAGEYFISTIRIPMDLKNKIERLARSEGMTSRNKMIEKLLDNAVIIALDMGDIDNAIEESKSIWGLSVDELKKKLEELKPLNVYHRVYLAKKLPLRKRELLFERMGWMEELDGVDFIDERLNNALQEKDENKYYNLRKLANSFNMPLTDFEEEYLKQSLSEKGFKKVKKYNPFVFPSLKESEEEELEEEESEERGAIEIEEGKEEIIKEPYEELETPEEEEEEEGEEWEEEEPRE